MIKDAIVYRPHPSSRCKGSKHKPWPPMDWHFGKVLLMSAIMQKWHHVPVTLPYVSSFSFHPSSFSGARSQRSEQGQEKGKEEDSEAFHRKFPDILHPNLVTCPCMLLHCSYKPQLVWGDLYDSDNSENIRNWKLLCKKKCISNLLQTAWGGCFFSWLQWTCSFKISYPVICQALNCFK